MIELQRTVPIFRPDELTSFLFTLPDHLRRTWFAVDRIGRANATQVAAVTGRARAVESMYLNRLAERGVLNKEHVREKRRGGTTQIFSISARKPKEEQKGTNRPN